MKLIFVYNADSGVTNLVKDIGHKLFSPQTYDCLLCSLTHGVFRENPEWKAFRNTSDIEMVFLHRNEFERRYDMTLQYPVILRETETEIDPVITREQMASFPNLAALIEAVKDLERQG